MVNLGVEGTSVQAGRRVLDDVEVLNRSHNCCWEFLGVRSIKQGQSESESHNPLGVFPGAYSTLYIPLY